MQNLGFRRLKIAGHFTLNLFGQKSKMKVKVFTSLFFCFVAHLQAEQLSGRVQDLSGRPLLGAQVILSRTRDTVLTDSNGYYRFLLRNERGRDTTTQGLFFVKDQAMSFLVASTSADVKVTLVDESNRLIKTLIDGNFYRGRYNFFPLAGIPKNKSILFYGIRIKIGEKTYFHRMKNLRDETRSGIIPENLSMQEISTLIRIPIDTLIASKHGFQTVIMPTLPVHDSLNNVIMTPTGFKAWRTDDKPYLLPASNKVEVRALLTVGEGVPYTDDRMRAYRMGGIPDGLGLRVDSLNRITLLMNHEIGAGDSVHAVLPYPTQRGSYVSEYILTENGDGILSGRPAFQSIRLGAWDLPQKGFFNRFCSGFMADKSLGFKDDIYLTGEESSNDSLAFSKRGGQAVGIANGIAYVLPDFGKMAFENVVVVPTENPRQTIAFALEDGPSRGSQLYLYVGNKIENARVDHLLLRNGLLGGKLYAFATESARDEGDFKSGKIKGYWIDPLKDRAGLIQGMSDVTAQQLDAWSRISADQKHFSLNFDRIEDGVPDRNRKGIFYFATTGDPTSTRNRYGRLYKLTFDPVDPLSSHRPPELEIIMHGDSARGFVSPDNLDMNDQGEMVICEDFNLTMPREPALWKMNLEKGKLEKLAIIDTEAVGLSNFKENVWESSGVIDASKFFGKGSWLVNVQAHSIRNEMAGKLQNIPGQPSFVQGGQLLLIKEKQ